MQIIARSEQCEADIRRKMVLWGTEMDIVDAVVEQLKTDGFIDDSRYARLFCREKITLQGWGRKKVEYALHQKNIPSSTIFQALQEVDMTEYMATLERVAKSKKRTIHTTDASTLRQKLLAFLLQRGFTYSEISEINEIITKI